MHAFFIHLIPFVNSWFVIFIWSLSWTSLAFNKIFIKCIRFYTLFMKITWIQYFLAVVILFIIIPSTADVYVPRKGIILVDGFKKNIDWICFIILSRKFNWQMEVIITCIIIMVPIVTGNILRLFSERVISVKDSFPLGLIFLFVQPLELMRCVNTFKLALTLFKNPMCKVKKDLKEN